MKTIDASRKKAEREGWQDELTGRRTDEGGDEARDRLEIPLDLSEWIGRSELLRWVNEAAARLDWNHPELQAYLAGHPDYRPKMLLTLISYAQLTGVFSSDGVVEKCYEDPLFRRMAENQPPSVQEVYRFRRENRGLIKGLVAPVLLEAVRRRFGLGDRLLPAGLRRFIVNEAVERLDLARHMDTAEE